ncbi:hypothetical protein RvY_01133 [Ramazzottius varieornatus]|uniref:Uncharacterized protein n=1 Tax=Ramazzottius varieornatus TaxID=947166 RepID=A0A1D1UIT8_RAMVA|nr:hypothetical protein RvY_01133 [Ramazzottius varieornatus]
MTAAQSTLAGIHQAIAATQQVAPPPTRGATTTQPALLQVSDLADMAVVGTPWRWTWPFGSSLRRYQQIPRNTPISHKGPSRRTPRNRQHHQRTQEKSRTSNREQRGHSDRDTDE